jgi:hypothetical protein
MSLFGDLPPAAVKKTDGAKAKKEEELDATLMALNQKSCMKVDTDKEEDDVDEADEADEGESEAQAEEELERPVKRVKFEADVQASRQAAASSGGDDDLILGALRRIASHISNPTKFDKANVLLRKVMESAESLDSGLHSTQLFETIRAAFSRPAMVADAVNRRDFMKLVASISALVEKQEAFFSKAELAHLDVYRLMGHVQGELGTDDSFQFAKSLAKLKEEVDDLQEATEEDSQALTRLSSEESGPSSCWQAAGCAQPTPDPLGEVRSSAWSTVEVSCMKREALLSITELTLKHVHHKMAWSRTGIELLVEHMHTRKAVFCWGSQQARVEELMGWVRQERWQRKRGPSAKEINRDSSAFDRDRKAWGEQGWISKNGKVGAGGDAKASGWLG